MWERIRPWLFPVWCLGCGVAGCALCTACSDVGAAPPDVVTGAVRVRAARIYAGLIAEAIVAMKRGERAYLEPLAALVAPLAEPGALLVPVPTTRCRSAERGFDQSSEIAARVARLRGCGYADVLRKRGAAQRGLGRHARLLARGRFTLRPRVEVPATAVLIDDVVTTGATLRDAAAALTAAGCRVAGALTIAATPGPCETPAARLAVARNVKAIWNGAVLAESDRTEVVEGNHYFPPEAVKREYFSASPTHTVCGWKGTASYYTVDVNGKKNPDAAWYYPQPLDAAKNITDYVAFWKGVEVTP